jgi:hypothetical protein
VSDDASGADPLRKELDARWDEYLEARVGQPDHDGWMLNAMSSYQDEIVHYGAQLLNDCIIRPWDADIVRSIHEQYVQARRDYDDNPEAWEAAFWDRVKARRP